MAKVVLDRAGIVTIVGTNNPYDVVLSAEGGTAIRLLYNGTARITNNVASWKVGEVGWRDATLKRKSESENRGARVMHKVLFIGMLLASVVPAAAGHSQEFDTFDASGSIAFGASGSIVMLARDDGRYANSPLKSWFDKLASGKGLCCSFADGFRVDDVDWDTQDGHYRVRLNGDWILVPDNTVVTEPNRYGPAVVWPYMGTDGQTQIRCFLPGAGA
jgi:hypothetical protein